MRADGENKYLTKIHKISSDIKRALTDIETICDMHKLEVYIAGGFVRDLILDIESSDIDIVIAGDAIQIAELFCKEYNGQIKTYPKFRTASMEIFNKYKIDFVSARQEFYEKHGALPKVYSGTIEDDLKRRDFTINSMAVSLNKKNYGEIIDYFNGQKDLQNRQIRVLYNMSFIDDPTRIFRAVRFGGRLGFEIEKNTANYMKEAIGNRAFDNISNERITRELLLSLKEPKRDYIIKRLCDFGIFDILYPELSIDNNIIDKMREISVGEDIILDSLLILFDNVNIEELKVIFERLKLNREYKKKIMQYIKNKEHIES